MVGFRRAFEVDDVAPLRHRALDLLVIGRLAKGHLDAEARQELGEDDIGTTVRVFHRNDPICRGKEREQRATDDAHTGGRARRSFGPLQVADLFLEGVDRRVGVASVDVTLSLPEGDVHPFIDVSITERDAVDDRNLRRPLHQ